MDIISISNYYIDRPTPDSNTFHINTEEEKNGYGKARKSKYTSSKLYFTRKKSSQTIHSLSHTIESYISDVDLFLHFISVVCMSFTTPPPSLLYHFLFSSLIFSLSFFPISILSSFDVANWRKKYVNNSFFVIVFQTELCKML